jgi:hypothetical protein
LGFGQPANIGSASPIGEICMIRRHFHVDSFTNWEKIGVASGGLAEGRVARRCPWSSMCVNDDR